MQLSEIVYPVFKIGTTEPIIVGGVTMIVTDKVDKEGNEYASIRIIDDKNINGSNLALRRINLDIENIVLYKLSKAIFFLGDLVKLAKSNVWFIDNAGKTFKYTKSLRCVLSFHKIANVISIPSGGVIVEVENIDTRFKALFAPTINDKYAGILHNGKSLILYGFYNQKYDNTWRKI